MAAAATDARVTQSGRSTNWISTGKLAVAVIDANETQRKTANITIQTPKAARALRGAMTRKAPNPVATPLPPRKRSHGGKQWPATTASMEAASQALSGLKTIIAQTAREPLAMSSTVTATPTFQPADRRALVAPTLPDPSRRTSRPVTCRTKM